MKYVKDYLLHVSVANAETTLEHYTERLARFESYRNSHPGKVTRLYTNGYFLHLISLGLSRESIHAHHGTLHAFFAWCCDCELEVENPVGRIALPPVQDKAKPIFTKIEYAQLIHCASNSKHNWWVEAIQMAWHTGLRMGDIAMMQWPQVDLVERLIRVTPNKTKRFVKKLELPIAEELGASLDRLSLKSEEKWVIPQMSIHYRWDRHKYLSMMFARIARKAGCQFQSFHGLRRSFTSGLVNSGVNPPVICSMTGHSLNQVMTYVQVSMPTKREAIQSTERQTA